jgi:hypothetical protein
MGPAENLNCGNALASDATKPRQRGASHVSRRPSVFNQPVFSQPAIALAVEQRSLQPPDQRLGPDSGEMRGKEEGEPHGLAASH